ncbi:DEAD/DEAH box helicase [Xylariales sp. PMI_506]|nr:DEAD/DEAH box helicase [Xylariales sp. PMI_506]
MTQESKRSAFRGNRRRGPRNAARPVSTSQPAPGRQHQQQQEYSTVAQPPLTIEVPADTPRFSDLSSNGLVDLVLTQTITQDMKFDHMTPVQAATIHQLLAERKDMLAQAKTGTGKTLAFLLPAIQTLIRQQRAPGKQISLLVISPTRELALQIAKEATTLLQRLPQYKVCTAIGGTNKRSEETRILKGCDILVGTPGRLLDHFMAEDGGYSDVHEMLQVLDTLVLDEADRLLDMGFLPDLTKIIRCLPDKGLSNRQGMLFSATIADHVQKVAHLALSENYKFISTIPEGEANTHQRVPQNLIVVPSFSDVTAGLVGALRQELASVSQDTFKVIIFAPTAYLVDFYAEILGQTPGLPLISALHSRLSQSKRTSITNDFRSAKNGILIATDVIARGMDFPAVTNVFQVGIPSDKESYIHRLGRTARAGAEGRGTFIVTAHERFFPDRTLKDIPFEEIPADISARSDVAEIAARVDPQLQTRAYQAWLGFYKTSVKQLGWTVDKLVQEANTLALDGLGSAEIPKLYKSTVGKMGLKGVRGLVVIPDPPRLPNSARGGRAPGGGGGGDSQSKRQRR